MPHAHLNDVEIFYELHGDKPDPVILLNGIGMVAEGWAYQLKDFGEHFRILTLDFRGQGKSSRPEVDFYSIEEQTEDVIRLFDQLAISRAHVVGLSYGGLVAQRMAVDYPDRVNRLVLSNTASFSDATAKAIFHAWEMASLIGGGPMRFAVSLPLTFGSRFLETQKGMIEFFAKMAETNPWDPLKRLAEGTLRHDLRERLSEVKAPTLVLASEEDRFMPTYHSELLAKLIPGARLEILRQCGHAAPLESPAEFNRAVLAFLTEKIG